MHASRDSPLANHVADNPLLQITICIIRL